MRLGGELALGKTVIADDQWHHVVVVYEVSDAGRREVRFYIDGVLESFAQRNKGHGIVNVASAASRPLRMGADLFSCQMDELYIVKGALNEESVQSLYRQNQL